jgi:hypothetical protein
MDRFTVIDGGRRDSSMKSVLVVTRVLGVIGFGWTQGSGIPTSFMVEVETPDGPLALEVLHEAAADLVADLGEKLRERIS